MFANKPYIYGTTFQIINRISLAFNGTTPDHQCSKYPEYGQNDNMHSYQNNKTC